MALERTLEERTLRLAELLRSFGLEPGEWYIADESVFALLGHAVPSPTGETTGIVVHVDAARLPFVTAAEGTLAPAPTTAAFEAVEAFSQAHRATPTFVPFTRHAIPITFRKLVDLGHGPIWVASLRGLGKIWLGELIELAAAPGGLDMDQLGRSSVRSSRLDALSLFDWPSRDRWFGVYCGELAALVKSFSAGASPTAKLQRLGRKHSLM